MKNKKKHTMIRTADSAIQKTEIMCGENAFQMTEDTIRKTKKNYIIILIYYPPAKKL